MVAYVYEPSIGEAEAGGFKTSPGYTMSLRLA